MRLHVGHCGSPSIRLKADKLANWPDGSIWDLVPIPKQHAE